MLLINGNFRGNSIREPEAELQKSDKVQQQKRNYVKKTSTLIE